MKLKKTEVPELVRTLKGEGLFTANLRYKVTECSGELDYCGPKIPHEVWNQILSFFKWTQATTGGESQVRLFVSPKLGTWKAWAFPQEASSGLSTKEIENEAAKQQRAALFENHDDWVAWGTVHHHCTISAFQSGTDEADEKNVGGLHITIGDMDKPQHSFHARLYHKGDLFEPDMSAFWDIGDVLAGCSPELLGLIPVNALDLIARRQMCAPSEAPFPDQWKENLIKVSRSWSKGDNHWSDYDYRGPSTLPNPKTAKEGDVEWLNGNRHVLKNGAWVKEAWKPETTTSYHGGMVTGDAEDALNEIMECLTLYNMPLDEMRDLIASCAEDDEISTVFYACLRFRVMPTEVLKEFDDMAAQKLAKEETNSNNAEDPNWAL